MCNRNLLLSLVVGAFLCLPVLGAERLKDRPRGTGPRVHLTIVTDQPAVEAKRAARLGVDFDIVASDGRPTTYIVKVDGREYTRTTDWRTVLFVLRVVLKVGALLFLIL